MSSSESQPFVSIIVPVHNGEFSIAKNIESLLVQEYPKEKLEIIIVNNNSTDNTKNILEEYHKDNKIILIEANEKRNSYVARNIGLKIAKGEIIAFTDADCMPKLNWISEGVNYMEEKNADLVGGNIVFSFSKNPTASELLDSIINLDNERSIRKQKTAKTANVFARKKVFESVGLFSEQNKSGGDTEWTARAVHAGFSIAFGLDAIVMHEARNFNELIKKHFRIGTGGIASWRARGKSGIWIFMRFCSLLTPFLPLRLPLLVKKRKITGTKYPIIRMMVIAYLCTLATASGIVYSFHTRKR